MGSFTVKVPNFEGPLDLLLFFIRRDELNIYDIPIAHITREFLEYIHIMQQLDLELAGEFIVMAAILMQIKARMMLPQMLAEGEDEEFVDPRTELTNRLLEYRRFKETAQELQKHELDQRQKFMRSLNKYDVREQEEKDENVLKDVTLFHLIKAFKNAMMNIPVRIVHEVRRIPYTIEDQGAFLLGLFRDRKRYSFYEVVTHMEEKLHLIITFVALLELIRSGRVLLEEGGEDFNDFAIINNVAE